MAWTSPMTFVSNNVLTASQLNTHLRDNMLEMAPAKATTALGSFFVSQGPNRIEERLVRTNRVTTTESTTSSTYTNLATMGPLVTVTTGTAAIVMIGCTVGNNAANQCSNMGYAISGYTTRDADDAQSLQTDGHTIAENSSYGLVLYTDELTPGPSTFTCKYKAGSDTSTFSNRFIGVFPL